MEKFRASKNIRDFHKSHMFGESRFNSVFFFGPKKNIKLLQ